MKEWLIRLWNYLVDNWDDIFFPFWGAWLLILYRGKIIEFETTILALIFTIIVYQASTNISKKE